MMAIIRIISSPDDHSWLSSHIGETFKVQRFIPKMGLADGPSAVIDLYDDRNKNWGPPYTCSHYAAFGQYELLNDYEELA